MIVCLFFIIVCVLFFTYLGQKFYLENLWKKEADSGRFRDVKVEPFPGALCLASIIESNIKDSEESARIMESVFGKTRLDWFCICKAVSRAESLNYDLLTENLAVIIKKQNQTYAEIYVPLIFKALMAAEFLFDEKTRPSEYLKSLLSYNYQNDRVADAYRVLGLVPGDSIEKVKKVHRKFVMKYHPDNNPDRTNVEMFLKIQEAYNIIIGRD